MGWCLGPCSSWRFALVIAPLGHVIAAGIRGAVLFRARYPTPAGYRSGRAMPTIGSMNCNAAADPTNEDPYPHHGRRAANGRGSFDQSGRGSTLTGLCSAITDRPSVWIAERKCFGSFVARRVSLSPIEHLLAGTSAGKTSPENSGKHI